MSFQVKCLLCNEILNCDRSNTANLLTHVREKHPDIKVTRVSDQVHATKMQSKSSIISLKSLQSKKKSKNSSLTSAPSKDIKSKKSIIVYSLKSESDAPKDNSSNYSSKLLKESYDDKNKSGHESLTDLIKQILKEHKNTCCMCLDQPTKCKPKDMISKFYNKARKSTPSTIYKREYKPKNYIKPKQKRKMYKTSIEQWKPGRSKIVCPICGANKRPVIRSHTDKVSNSPIGAACLLTCWPFCFMPCLFPPPKIEYLHCTACHHCLGVYDSKNGALKEVDENEE